MAAREICLCILLLSGLCALSSASVVSDLLQDVADKFANKEKHVSIELFVMSRCPDAQHVENNVMDALLEKLHNIVKIKTTYIANLTDTGVVCKHGADECAGNVQQLCVEKFSDLAGENYDIFWQFIKCVNGDPPSVGTTDSFSRCLDTLGLSQFSRAMVELCTTSAIGRKLLEESVKRSKVEGAFKSCTIHIDGKYRCTYDGGKFYECDGGSDVTDFERDVCDAFADLNGYEAAECSTDPSS